MKIEGVTAIVTGGASGLGEGTARALAEAGARVAVFDMNREKGETVAREIGGRFFACNVADEASVDSAFAGAVEFGEPRIVVTCAGIVRGEKTASKGTAHSSSLFQQIIAVNLTGTFLCVSRAAARMQNLPALDDGERGVIVMTSSVSAFDGQVGQIAYSASKGAVAGMTLPMARDLARDGIRAVSIAPGLFNTAMVEGLPDVVRASLQEQTLFPSRPGKPGEFGALVRHICENPMLNGETIRLDGAIRLPPR
ncbi:MAG: SDR family NAD(P)-dependent oxidoreductase [Rhodobacteraceae bacterium]|nr:SDR family NAD(P)-dependent oxidoreductase [Paracoccaceae bacterium]